MFYSALSGETEEKISCQVRFRSGVQPESPYEFAENVKVCLNTDVPGGNARRTDLEQKDPEMFRFLKDLFRDISAELLK